MVNGSEGTSLPVQCLVYMFTISDGGPRCKTTVCSYNVLTEPAALQTVTRW